MPPCKTYLRASKHVLSIPSVLHYLFPQESRLYSVHSFSYSSSSDHQDTGLPSVIVPPTITQGKYNVSGLKYIWLLLSYRHHRHHHHWHVKWPQRAYLMMSNGAKLVLYSTEGRRKGSPILHDIPVALISTNKYDNSSLLAKITL